MCCCFFFNHIHIFFSVPYPGCNLYGFIPLRATISTTWKCSLGSTAGSHQACLPWPPLLTTLRPPCSSASLPLSPASHTATTTAGLCWAATREKKKRVIWLKAEQAAEVGRVRSAAGSWRGESGVGCTINSIERGRKLIFLDYFPMH